MFLVRLIKYTIIGLPRDFWFVIRELRIKALILTANVAFGGAAAIIWLFHQVSESILENVLLLSATFYVIVVVISIIEHVLFAAELEYTVRSNK
jgi:hypothetical protein